jgi:LemA protein
MLFGFVAFAAIVATALWFLATYNHLVATKQRVAQAWSSIDVLLRERDDELPKVIETCALHMTEEQTAIERLTSARSAMFSARHGADPAALGRAEIELRAALARLLSEGRHPELLETPPFAALQRRMRDLDAGISTRREAYNAAVNDNNVAIDLFPGRVVAGIAGFHTLEPLESFDAGSTVEQNSGDAGEARSA